MPAPIVLSGKDLEALPDDPDELQRTWRRWPDPQPVPTAARFTSMDLPADSFRRSIDPRDSHQSESVFGRIRQAGLRTNRNLHQARHGQVPWPVLGRGQQFGIELAQSVPRPRSQQPYDSVIYQGNIGGPINKKASFFFNVQRRNIDEIAVVNAPHWI